MAFLSTECKVPLSNSTNGVPRLILSCTTDEAGKCDRSLLIPVNIQQDFSVIVRIMYIQLQNQCLTRSEATKYTKRLILSSLTRVNLPRKVRLPWASMPN